MRDRNVFVGTTRKLYRRTKYKAAFHGLRLPLYAIRWTRRAVLGLGRAIYHGWRWVFDLEGYALRRHAADSMLASEYLRLREQQHHRVKLRLWAAVGTALTAAVGMGIAETASPVSLPAAGLAAFVTLGIVGKPADAPPILDTAVIPLSVELTGEHLNSAFRACGLLGKDAELVIVQPIMRDAADIGYTAVVDLPKGGGKKAADVLAARDGLAAELGVDEVQLQLWRIRARDGGHAARIGLWVADDDPYLTGDKTPSPMADMDSFSVWEPIPFGSNARAKRVAVLLMWQSMFIGGLPRRGKSFAQRILAVAAVLDPWCRIYCADGKGGRDWKALSRVAHRYIAGAEDAAITAFIAMLKELIAEMERRFALLNTLPDSVTPEGKLTPEIARKYKMPPVFIVIDELQEFLSSMEEAVRKQAVEYLCRLARRAPAAGFVLIPASQRPDAESVPTKLREIISYRFSVQCKDAMSSDMVLGKGMASIGANAALLSPDHLGVGVLVTGPTDFDTIKTDYIDLPQLSVICERGRTLRRDAKTLSGDAAGALADLASPEVVIPAILTDCLSVMRHAPQMHTTTLLTGLAALDDDAWGDLTPETLAEQLDAAGVVRSVKQVKVDGTNLAGYRRGDLEAALPATWIQDDAA
jgi:S-DNA-T family DNA segregation ATPase FtsK/SpoIIIE